MLKAIDKYSIHQYEEAREGNLGVLFKIRIPEKISEFLGEKIIRKIQNECFDIYGISDNEDRYYMAIQEYSRCYNLFLNGQKDMIINAKINKIKSEQILKDNSSTKSVGEICAEIFKKTGRMIDTRTTTIRQFNDYLRVDG